MVTEGWEPGLLTPSATFCFPVLSASEVAPVPCHFHRASLYFIGGCRFGERWEGMAELGEHDRGREAGDNQLVQAQALGQPTNVPLSLA